MNKSYVILGSIGAAIIAFIAILFTCIGTMNSYSRLEVKAKAATTDNRNVLDNTRKSVREAAAVSSTEVAALEKLIVGYAEARGSNEGGGDNNVVSIGMVREAVPSITTVETLTKLQNIVVAGRKDWQAAQTRLIEIKRQGDEMLAVFPGSLVLGMMGKQPIEIQIVTSTETEENFRTGKDDGQWIGEPSKAER